MKPQKLYAFSVSAPESRSRTEGDRIIISGKVPVNLIVIDSEGIPVLCEREAEFDFSRIIDDENSGCCMPQVSLSGCSANLMSDGRIDFKAELFINVAVAKNVREKVLTSLEIEEDKGKKDKKPSVVIYFCSGGESVWDIARRYNTTVEDIMSENELSADYLENKRMLLIPVK